MTGKNVENSVTDEPCPCNECEQREKCNSEDLACGVYEVWTDTGRVPDIERNPTPKGTR